MKKRIAACAVFTIATLVGCGKDSETTAKGKGVVETTFSAAETALKSSGTVFSTSSFQGNGRVSVISRDNSTMLAEAACSNFGAGTGDTQMNNTMDYIACVLTSDSGSPETAKGAMSIVKQIFTSAEKGTTFRFAETDTDHQNVSFKVTTSDGDFTGKIGIREKATGSTVWNKVVHVCFAEFTGPGVTSFDTRSLDQCVAGQFHMSIYLNDLNGNIAFKVVNQMWGSFDEMFVFALNRTAGTMRYETWSTRSDSKSHTRYFVNGVFNENFELSTVSSVKFAYAIPKNSSDFEGVYADFDGSRILRKFRDDHEFIG